MVISILYYRLLLGLLTKVCSKVLDKLDPVLLFLPELEMAILTGSSNEVSPKMQCNINQVQNLFINCFTTAVKINVIELRKYGHKNNMEHI